MIIASSNHPANQTRTENGTGAKIVDGHFETDEAKGTIGGAHKVVITGWDGIPYSEEGETVEDGHELFPEYTTTFDFPKEDTEKNFEVPKK